MNEYIIAKSGKTTIEYKNLIDSITSLALIFTVEFFNAFCRSCSPK